MVLVLAAAAVFIYLAVYLVKRLSRPAAAEDPYLKVLASAHLGSNRYVHVVALGTKAYIVGAAEGSVTLIAEAADQETVDAMLLDQSRRTSQAAQKGLLSGFRQLLAQFTGAQQTGGRGITPENIKNRRKRFKGF
jgi:flagellar protein FliO/FliZ